MASTLSTAIPVAGSSTAIVIPRKPRTLTFSFGDLHKHVLDFQKKLARLGIAPQDAVSIALPNSYEFIVAFLATARQRAIAAPLNPTYKQDEFEFYIDDLKSSVVLVPKGSYEFGGPAVPLTHLNLTTTMRNIKTTYELSPDDRTLLVMPLFHVHGLLAAYAMTEGAHQITSNPLPPAKRYPGSVGIGMGVEVKILDPHGIEVPQGSEAEICIRGNNVTKGYLNNPEANKSSFTAGGFFRTGDQGKKDEEGYVIITGRIKELINKGGEKISPVEIDNLVAQHPAIAEAVSFAVPDGMYGQDIGIALVLKEDAGLTGDELRKWMANRVAKFKVPKQVVYTLTARCSNDSLRLADLFYEGHAKDCHRKGPATHGGRGHV
ncbi:MAG: hypothetical protein LQ338_002121 [Usnochroma carphineum]|nr:MAG: hypothetical protein LQ338_002121 [Usnochroma carphineum]